MCLAFFRWLAVLGMGIGCVWPSYAGPWGQASGQWYTQIEGTTGYIEGPDLKVKAISAYAETGVGHKLTLSASHYASFLSNTQGSQEASQFNAQDTRLAVDWRVFQTQKMAMSLGVGRSNRQGLQNPKTRNIGVNLSYSDCPNGYTDAAMSFGYNRIREKKVRRRWLGPLSVLPQNTLYIFDAKFDLNGDKICRENRLGVSMLQQGKKLSREVYVWHTQVDETGTLERVGRLSSTKYRVLYRYKIHQKMSIYYAVTAERSNNFLEGSGSIGVTRKFG